MNPYTAYKIARIMTSLWQVGLHQSLPPLQHQKPFWQCELKHNPAKRRVYAFNSRVLPRRLRLKPNCAKHLQVLEHEKDVICLGFQRPGAQLNFGLAFSVAPACFPPFRVRVKQLLQAKIVSLGGDMRKASGEEMEDGRKDKKIRDGDRSRR